MTHRLILFNFFISLMIQGHGQNELGAIGSWREHYNNQSIIQLAFVNPAQGEKKIVGASTQQVFFLDQQNKVDLMGKSTGLNDLSISCTAWDEEQKQLIVAYQNSNIDIIKGDQVYSITDLMLSNLYVSKKINHIYLLQPWAILSTDFGMVVVDLIKYEIKDTWFPNNNRQVSKTFQVVSTADQLFAATETGIWTCSIKNNWITISQWQNNPSWLPLAITKLTQFNNNVFLANKHAIYQWPIASPYIAMNNSFIKNLKANKDGLFTSLNNGTKGSLVKINTDKTTITIVDSLIVSNPMDFLLEQNNIWVADSNKGLLLKNTTEKWIGLGGPASDILGQMFINKDYLLAPLGDGGNGFSFYNNAGWNAITSDAGKKLPPCYSSAIDPIDGRAWFTSSEGLLQYNFEKRSIERDGPSGYDGMFSNIQFSNDGTLWVLLEDQGILQRKQNLWKLIKPPNNISLIGIKKMVVNQQGQVWFIAPQQSGILVYNPNNNSEPWSNLTTFKNNLPSSQVSSIMEDKNGTMWVGTDNGIGLFDCNEINTCKAYLPQIKNNNGFTGLLFQKETVNCMTVDGANRKWIGTNNGTWLLNSDGTEIIQRFNKNNSPIPNDTIRQIVIEPTTGEVFFNTQDQMVSYRSTATNGSVSMEQIQIYPNPIPPQYNGTIAIKGLVENADVKITTIDGKLVFQTKSLGGQAIWDGKTYQGNNVSSGVYLVFARDETGQQKAVGKIVISFGY